MAKLSGQKLYLGEVDLSALAYDITWNMGVETPPDADFADTAAVVMAGLNTAQVSGNARYTTGATGTDTLISAKNGVLFGPVSLVFGTAEGDTVFSLDALQTNYSTAQGSAGDKHQVAWSCVPGGDLIIGQLLKYATSAATGNSTGLELGLLGAGFRMYSILHVFVGSGGNLDVLVESASDAPFTSPTTRITHTQATAPTSEILTLNGAIATDTFWRSDYTISAGSFSFVHAVGIMEVL